MQTRLATQSGVWPRSTARRRSRSRRLRLPFSANIESPDRLAPTPSLASTATTIIILTKKRGIGKLGVKRRRSHLASLITAEWAAGPSPRTAAQPGRPPWRPGPRWLRALWRTELQGHAITADVRRRDGLAIALRSGRLFALAPKETAQGRGQQFDLTTCDLPLADLTSKHARASRCGALHIANCKCCYASRRWRPHQNTSSHNPII